MTINFGYTNSANGQDAACCIGPQNGEPLCPCQMKGIMIKEGRCASWPGFVTERSRVKELENLVVQQLYIIAQKNRMLNNLIPNLEAERDAANTHAKILNDQNREIILTIERVKAVGKRPHPSWHTSEEFSDGWEACREQIGVELGAAMQENLNETS